MIGKYSLAFLLFLPVSALAQGDILFDPATGYRIADYRAPVPATVPGAQRIETADIAALKAEAAVFIDVYPLKKHNISKDGSFLNPPPHDTIPGAVWLPIVGPGRIDAAAQAYLEAALDTLSGGDPARPIVVFCLTDCWMSWNASQRIAKLGYTRVYWYPEGSDGWSLAGNILNRVQPFPVHVEMEQP